MVPITPISCTCLLPICPQVNTMWRMCNPCYQYIASKCAYTLTLVIDITTDSNDIHLVSWGSVSSVQLSVMQHYWLFAINKIYWIPSHFHDERVDPKHITTKQEPLFHNSKLSLTKSIIFSHFCKGLVVPWKAPSSAKCKVHFNVQWKLKSFMKPWRLTSL
jgi:hypothetical protein